MKPIKELGEGWFFLFPNLKPDAGFNRIGIGIQHCAQGHREEEQSLALTHLGFWNKNDVACLSLFPRTPCLKSSLTRYAKDATSVWFWS